MKGCIGQAPYVLVGLQNADTQELCGIDSEMMDLCWDPCTSFWRLQTGNGRLDHLH